MEVTYDDHEVLRNYIKKYLTPSKNAEKPVHLIIKPECNQKCEYCYLYKHGTELYPLEKRKTNKEILNNINLLLDYFKENNIFEDYWEFFAGDLFYDNFWFDIMDSFYDYYKYMQNKKILPIVNRPEIIMPCNMSFCNDDKKIAKVEEYVNKFQKDLNVKFNFSYSTDGKYSTDIRERHELSDEFYDKVFSLMRKYHWQSHPMISYEGIENGIKNYIWWKEQYQKYFIKDCSTNILPPFLEVRNAGWTDEKIDSLLKLLDYMIMDRFSMFDYNIENFTKHLFFPEKIQKEQKIIPSIFGHDIIKLAYMSNVDNFKRCTLGLFLSINCADLSIVPCHRLTYSFFTGGQFYIENNKITDIKALEGINGYLNHRITNTHFELDCYGCENRYFCKRGCRGAQFEYSSESFLPIPDVCKMLDAELSFLAKKYSELGVFNYLFTQTEYKLEPEYKKRLINFLKTKGYPEYEYKYG